MEKQKQKIEMNYQNTVLTLPGSVIQKMETASEQDLRVLLHLAANADLRERFDAAKLSTVLDLPEQQIEISVAFWRGAGVLKTSRAKKTSDDTAPEEEKSEKESPVVTPVFAQNALPNYTGAEIERLVKERRELAGLLKECQSLLEKVFNVSESNKIIALVDYLHLPEEYILLLCGYCKSKGKGSVAYVAATATGLFNDGVVTMTALEEYIAEREKSQDFENYMRHLCGIGGRKLTAKEKNFFVNWQKMGFNYEIISYAYELSVDAAGELSFPHLNKILEGFSQAGVKTLEDAEKYTAQHKEEMKKLYAAKNGAKEQNKPKELTSFDVNEFFELAKKKGKEAMTKAENK